MKLIHVYDVSCFLKAGLVGPLNKIILGHIQPEQQHNTDWFTHCLESRECPLPFVSSLLHPFPQGFNGEGRKICVAFSPPGSRIQSNIVNQFPA